MYLERFRLDGELAVVTGGGRGIGLASADALGEAGARLAIIERDPAAPRRGPCDPSGEGLTTFPCTMGDVTDPARMQAIADELTAKGGASILVNNAGIALSDIPAEDMEDERWLKVIDVNLNGVLLVQAALSRQMLSAGRGSIVNVGSMSGFIVNRPSRRRITTASKAAVHHLTKSLRRRMGAACVRSTRSRPPTSKRRSMRSSRTTGPCSTAGSIPRPWGAWARTTRSQALILFLSSRAASLMTDRSCLRMEDTRSGDRIHAGCRNERIAINKEELQCPHQDAFGRVRGPVRPDLCCHGRGVQGGPHHALAQCALLRGAGRCG